MFYRHPAWGVVIPQNNLAVATDTTRPSVTINKGASQADPTSTSPILFDIVFSEPVIGFINTDITVSFSGGGTPAISLSGSGATYTATVTGMTTAGNVTASIAANVCTDAAGNLNFASTSTDNIVAWTVATGDITTGLVHQWRLNDANSGTSTDGVLDSVGSITGTSGTGVTSTAGPSGALYGTARAFDGTYNASFILLSSIPFNWLSAFSIAGWLKLTSVSAAGLGGIRPTFFSSCVDNTDANMIRILNDQNIGGGGASPGALAVNVAGGVGIATPVGSRLVDDTWAHFCYTDTGGGATKKLYFNGALVTHIAASGGGLGNTNLAMMGGSSDGAAGWPAAFPGAMYRIEIWNRVLSAADVALLFATK